MKVGTKIGKRSMRSAAVVERLVTREEARTRSRMLAYRAVADHVGRSADWVRRLIRDGSSIVTVEIRNRLDEMLVRGLEADIARLQAELDLARASGAHPASAHVGEIETHLAEARSLLNGAHAE